MIKWKKYMAVAVLAAVFGTGCTRSNIFSPETAATIPGDGIPDVEIVDDLSLDWLELREDLRDEYLEPYGPFGDFVMDLAVYYDKAEKLVTLQLPVTRKTTVEIAQIYGEDVLRHLGSFIADQDFSYEAPDLDDYDSTYYGSFFDENAVCVQVFHYNVEGSEDKYLINDTIEAGAHRGLRGQAQ